MLLVGKLLLPLRLFLEHVVMRKIIFALMILMAAFSQPGVAGLRDMWINMPDSISGSLDRNGRIEMTDFADMHVRATVNNMLGDSCQMDTMTADYLQVTVSKSSRIEMRMLPLENGDSILCMVSTFYGPEPDSEIRFYDMQWSLLPTDDYMPKLEKENFIHRPDTMSLSHFKDLSDSFDPVMISCRLDVGEPTVTAELSVPMSTSDEKREIDVIRHPVSLKWNGKKFHM